MPIRPSDGQSLDYPADKTPPRRLHPVISAATAGSAAAASAMRTSYCPGDHRSPLPLADVRKREPSSPLARLDEAVAGAEQSFASRIRWSVGGEGGVIRHCGRHNATIAADASFTAKKVSGRIISKHVNTIIWGAVAPICVLRSSTVPLPYQTQCRDQRETCILYGCFWFLQDGHNWKSGSKRQKPIFLYYSKAKPSAFSSQLDDCTTPPLVYIKSALQLVPAIG